MRGKLSTDIVNQQEEDNKRENEQKMNGLFVEEWRNGMEMTRSYLLQDIRRMLRLATTAQLDLIWRFMRQMIG